MAFLHLLKCVAASTPCWSDRSHLQTRIGDGDGGGGDVAGVASKEQLSHPRVRQQRGHVSTRQATIPYAIEQQRRVQA